MMIWFHLRILVATLTFFLSWSPIPSDGSQEAMQLMEEKLERAFMIVCQMQGDAGIMSAERCRNELTPPEQSRQSPAAYAKHVSRSAPPMLKKYQRPCKKLIQNLRAVPEVNESVVLHDHGLEYDLRAYAHCLIHSVRNIDGDEILKLYINDNKATQGRNSLVPKRDWLKTIHEEGNKFRILHGVRPLILNDTLNKDAQEMADNITRTCKLEHSDRDDREKNTGEWTGENLCWRQADEAIDDIAERCANAWYEEVKYYPFPKGWDHEPDGSADALLKKFGHFTQMVWKDSWYVGYGIGSTRNCSKDGRLEYYVVARYLPGGNRRCCFVGSVFPRKASMPRN